MMEDKSVKNFFNIIDSVLLCMFRVFAFCVMLYGVAYLGEIHGVILLIILCIFGVFYSKEILNNFKKDTDDESNLTVKYKYVGEYEKPKKQTVGSAGIDLFNNTDKAFTIKPNESVYIPTGMFVEIPEGYVGLLFARGSLGYKYGCTLTNSVGVIDSDYRGEIMARITNISQESHTIKAGERCIQLVIVPVPDTKYVEDELNVTERGTNGFGSTGRD